MLQNHLWAKDPEKVQEKPMDFNVAGYKNFTDMVPGSTLELIFKKLLLVDY